MVTSVFFFGVCSVPGFTGIDFSISPNRNYDWLTIGDMLEGKIPTDTKLLESVNIKVRSKIKKLDFMLLSGEYMVSESLKQVILDTKAPGLRWTRLFVNSIPYYVLSVESVIDCLDREKSVIRYFKSNPSKVMEINKYCFHKNLIPETAIFKIREKSMRLFVTPTVKDKIMESGAIGFRFFDIENPPPDELVG